MLAKIARALSKRKQTKMEKKQQKTMSPFTHKPGKSELIMKEKQLMFQTKHCLRVLVARCTHPPLLLLLANWQPSLSPLVLHHHQDWVELLLRCYQQDLVFSHLLLLSC
jgi:hypothetical protein